MTRKPSLYDSIYIVHHVIVCCQMSRKIARKPHHGSSLDMVFNCRLCLQYGMVHHHTVKLLLKSQTMLENRRGVMRINHAI
jgi:hypothetical protein